ncbi:uncharacterized protein IWZ02DRAFT_505509 [Phyllosticta citriasiana]|uniref:uncharacterized protein n=1 Tax=Phyllosticta citriasiana TaxID=595635 RepID=UPI0030FD9DEE
MIWLLFVLSWLFASASTLHLRQIFPLVRQASDLVDPYPCTYCDYNDPLNVGPDTCTDVRGDEIFCDIIDDPSDMWASEFALNATTPFQQGSNEPLKWDIIGTAYYFKLISYPSCAKASTSSASKWWGFPSSTDGSCPLEVKKLADTEVDVSRFQNDHVYERQLLVDFFKWLAGDFDLVRWPQGYERPSLDWIVGRVLGLSTSLGLEPFKWQDRTLWEHLIREMGCVYHKERLALVDSKINNYNGTFFSSSRPSAFPSKRNDIGNVKSHQRNVTGVFQYMRQDEIWSLMSKTSQALEDTFRFFDVEYGWDDDERDILGRPERRDGEGFAGLRDIYCHWIDERLRNIEYNAGVWLQTAKATFEKSVVTNPANPNEKQDWVNQYDNGILSEDSFKFPRIHQEITDGVYQNSEFSMWDNGPAGPF